MKNIHILPTDKSSSLYREDDGTFGYDFVLKSYGGVDHYNIHITSDEDIKEGDWMIRDNEHPTKVTPNFFWDFGVRYFKIILTTDQDLIKDGVQAIDDKFLEWFVKNPSCEDVEVISNSNYEMLYKVGASRHKIIIPKEEPKQCDICKMFPILEGTNKCESCYSVVRYFLEQDPRFKDNLLPDLRKKQETSSVGIGNQIFKIVLDEKWSPKKVSIIEADNNSVLKKQETLEKITEQIQNECHIFVESVTNVTYQDATNTFLFMKLAELTLKLKKYE